MYTTIKEIYVELEQRIQQVTSNRHKSIPFQLYDIALNTCAIRSIQSKTNSKTNYKREGFEDSKKRVEDFQNLKRSTGMRKVRLDENLRPYVIVPADYLKFVASDSNVYYSMWDENLKSTKGETVTYSIIDFSSFDPSLITSSQTARITVNGTVIDITDILKLALIEDASEEVDLYDFYNHIVDRLRINGVNAYWQDYNGIYKPKCIITANVDSSVVSIFNVYNVTAVVNVGVVSTSQTITFNTFVKNGLNVKGNDLLSSEQIRELRDNYYYSIGRHNNPTSELINDRLYVDTGMNFIISHIDFQYIKRPRLFSGYIDQVSDIEITTDFMDLVVSEILLILKDNSYNAVKQNSNIE